jgi:photoactive yellow protein
LENVVDSVMLTDPDVRDLQAIAGPLGVAAFAVEVSPHGADRLAFINARYERMFGLRNDEVAGRPLAALGDPAATARLADAVRRCVAEDQPVSLELEVATAAGKVWCQATVAPVQREGRPAGVIGVCTDISAHRRLTMTLEAAQRMARLGWWRHNLTTGEKSWSAALYEMAGRDPALGPARRAELLEIVHPQDRPALLRRLGEPEPGTLELRIVRPDGEIRHLRDELAIERDSQGRPVELSGTVQDVTERTRLEVELRAAVTRAEAASEAKSRFLANMSHELRTPLNAIIGFSEMIAEQMLGPAGNATYVEYAGDIHFAGRHLLDVVNDILDMARIEADQTELREETVELDELLAEVGRILRERASHARLELAVLPAPAGIQARGDRRLLRQALLNLAGNAVKFTEGGGRVAVGAHVLSDGQLCFFVSDMGIGIAAADLPTALAPFGRIGSHLQAKVDGTGLGLPLARALAELHGGALFLNSQPGIGTTAFLTLPRDRVVGTGDGSPEPTLPGLKEFFRFHGEHVGELVERLGPADLDDLPVGVIQLDATGRILAYNATEARFSGRTAELVVGRNFFREVAPCTFTAEFFERFRNGMADGHLSAIFSYVFAFPRQSSKVLVEMRSGREPGTAWLFIRWV